AGLLASCGVADRPVHRRDFSADGAGTAACADPASIRRGRARTVLFGRLFHIAASTDVDHSGDVIRPWSALAGVRHVLLHAARLRWTSWQRDGAGCGLRGGPDAADRLFI